MGIYILSGGLCGEMVRTLAPNARDVGSIPAQGTTFPIFISPINLVTVTMILYKLLNLLYVCVCTVTACMYLIIHFKRLKIPGGLL